MNAVRRIELLKAIYPTDSYTYVQRMACPLSANCLKNCMTAHELCESSPELEGSQLDTGRNERGIAVPGFVQEE